jgi:heavy metal sensor kinase
MRSIRWSLLLYFLLALALAMGAVSLLAYQRMQVTVEEKERATAGRLRDEYDAKKAEERKRLDEKLLAKARTLVTLAQFHSNANTDRFHIGSQAGRLLMGMTPSPSSHFAGALMQMPGAIYWSNQGPFADALHRANMAELNFNEEELYRDKGDDPGTEYFQVDSNFWGASWRSTSMGDRTLAHGGQLGALLAGGNVSPLHVLAGLAVRPEEDPLYPVLEPQWDDRELEPDHIVRCVSLKAPVWWGSLRGTNRWGYAPQRPGGRTFPREPPRNPNTPSWPQPDGPRFFVYVQCASDTTDRDHELAALDKKLQGELGALSDESEASLASLRAHLWLICVAAFTSAAVGGYVLVLIGLWPLKRVGEAVSKVSPKDFKLPLGNRPLPIELRPIVERLNATFDLLKRAFAREKQAVADISHDLRTPVAALLAATEVALRKPRSAEQYREVIQDCHATGKQMSRIVECLLALARLDAGVDRVRTCDFDVAELAEECVNLVRPLAAERQLGLELNRNGPISLHTDPDKIREVLTNLLHNAIQYNRPKGNVSLTVERENGTVRLAVSDTGIGIAPEARERIFERFFRADPSRQGDVLGDMAGGFGDSMHSGLGLAIVKGYIDLLGGTIQVESALGLGTTFRVELPAAPIGSAGAASEGRLAKRSG